MTTNNPDYKAVYNQDPEVGQALCPILDRFESAPPLTYGEIAKALLDAYQAGQKNGFRHAREVALESFKKAVNG